MTIDTTTARIRETTFFPFPIGTPHNLTLHRYYVPILFCQVSERMRSLKGKVDPARQKEFRRKFRVLGGLPINEVPAHRIALSLVHPLERIDIAVSAIRWIEARRYKFYNWGKKSVISTSPFVEICIVPYVREQIYRLSKQIIGDPLQIVIDGEDVIKPVVREPLGIHECISISQSGYEDAVALAERLRARWSNVRPKLV